MQRLATPFDAAFWLRQHVSGSLCSDSRQVRPGDGFLAWPGAATDARTHVAAALAAGAAACLVEHAGIDDFDWGDAAVASYAGLKAASGPIASDFYASPSRSLAVLAVTGTNGKTSSTWWLAQALSNLELTTPIPCAVVGTLGIGVPPDDVHHTGLTTPDPVALQSALADFVGAGLQACAIEASSIGIEEHRLDGTWVHTAIFTNLTQDHLDYHGSMAAYAQAKRRLFAWPGLRAAVLNVDDPMGAQLAGELAEREPALDLWTVSMQGCGARLQAQAVRHGGAGLHFEVLEGEQRLSVSSGLIGSYNVANLLGVLAAMRSLGVSLAAAVQACSRLAPVPGRMQCVQQPGAPLAVVDYAHTPDALAKTLQALQPLAQQRGGRLWCVFGCGGDRDASKRPLMGAVAAAHAVRVVVTSDNPRSESPQVIVDQILRGLTGVPDVCVELDRGRAIGGTLTRASATDVVLVAGKGHEDYQEVAGQRLPFSDLAQVRQALAQRALQAPAMMSLLELGVWLGQPLAGPTPSAPVRIQRVHTDTRSLAPGDLFVALRGERFDGSDFLAQARDQGAVAAICQGEHAPERLMQAGLPGLVVPDSRIALGQLGRAWRAQWSGALIAVTGSNGKTTVTQMVAAILRAAVGEAALATQGNLNNDIGVPLTLLRLRPGHRIAVLELGMNHPGEIAVLAGMAQPTVALVNNAQREHLEFMHTVQAVAAENGAVIGALPVHGVAVFAADDAHSAVWQALAGARRVLRFAAQAQADAEVYPLQALWQDGAWQVRAATPAGELDYRLHIAGAHNVKNSLAALTCALGAGVPLAAIGAGLSAFEPVKGRSRAQQLRLGTRTLTLVDDTYNANPDSVHAAIDVLAALPGPRLLVLGDMAEVGDQGPHMHIEALAHALEKKIEKVLVTGSAFAQAAMKFDSVGVAAQATALQAAVLAELPRVASVLVKGSRFMKMEQVVEAIMAAAPETGGAAC